MSKRMGDGRIAGVRRLDMMAERGRFGVIASKYNRFGRKRVRNLDKTG